MAAEWDERAAFTEALQLPAADRAAFLARVCPDETARKRVEALLAAHAAGLASVFESAAETIVAGGAGEPRMVEEFRVVRRVGQGGMGVVYLAEDTTLGRPVALKVLAPDLMSSESALGRFREEARTAARLNHPGIVPVYKFGFDGLHHYISSEYIDGPTLAAQIETESARRRTLTTATEFRGWHRRTAETIAAVADALDYSHRAGVIHRDVKPSNILIDRERGPRLTDFGIAKHAAGTLTHQTTLIGSCHYMSPEQASTIRTIDQRSDVFSLGVVMYEMLALKRPFDGDDIHHVLRAVIDQEPQALRSLNPRIPKDLATICHKALEKAPRDRYQSAGHVAADLRSYLAGDPILARPPGVGRRVVNWVRRRPRATTVLATAGLLALVSWIAVSRVRSARDESVAWVGVDLHGNDCVLLLQRHDAVTLAPLSPESLGRTSIVKLPVGQYRLTAVRADGAQAEFNLLLLEPGAAARRVVHVIDRTAAFPIGAAPGDLKAPPRALVGVLHPNDVRLAGMIRVPAGRYSLAAESNATPLNEPIQLDEFYIDATKTTNGEYAEFIRATGSRRPSFWLENDPQTILDLPVVGVSQEEAEAYARWRGKRLPTLHEWQAAARGPTGESFPGGRAPTEADEPPESARVEIESTDRARHRELYLQYVVPAALDAAPPVPARPLQVHSNVRELCATAYLPSRSVYVVGRAWFDPLKARPLGSVRQFPINMPSPHNGFRCAASAPQKSTP